MITIELELENKISTENIRTLLLQMKTMNSMFEVQDSKAFNIMDNIERFIKEKLSFDVFNNITESVSEELQKKWNLKDDFCVIVDGELARDLYSLIDEKYNKINTISQMNDEHFLSKVKKRVEQAFLERIEMYTSDNLINENLISNIKEELKGLINEKVNQVAKDLFNDNAKNKLSNLANTFDTAYANLNYTEMNKISKKIEKQILKNPFFKDEELLNRLKIDLSINNLIQNKLKNGKKLYITPMEMNLIKQFSHI